jgi:hypothetical protein
LLGVDTQLGAAFETDTRLRAVANVRELAAGDYELQLRYETSSGATDERLLRGESCRAVTDAAVLLLAIALNPSPALAEDPQPTPAREPLFSPNVGLVGELDSAVLARLAFALGVQLGLRIGPVELQARGQYFPARSETQLAATTTFTAYSFDLGMCTPWRFGIVTVGPCARVELGRLSGRVAGRVQEQRPGAARFQALALGGEVRVRVVAPLWLLLSADFTWFLRRPEFLVTDLGEVGRPAKFGMRVYLGPLVAW